MFIKDFVIGKKYKRDDLMAAFKGAFQGGINICKRTNTIVITSKHTGNRIYDDKLFDGDIMYYTGEGQVGNQKMWKGNKAILEAKENGRDIHLFVRFKSTEYTYYGIVELAGEPYYADEKDINGQVRKVIKFPMVRCSSKKELSEKELNEIHPGGIFPMEKPTLLVVGAAIINKKGEVLCAMRGAGELSGKWEFPGGKVEPGETEEQALVREIKEELNIEIKVHELIDENIFEYVDKNVNLKVYKCSYVSGEIKDVEHKEVSWKKPSDMEHLDWAAADKPIAETYIDSLPKKIDPDLLQFDYFEAEGVKPGNKESFKSVEDYERSEKAKQKSGEDAELAVIHYERSKLNNLGHPELADLVEQISKINSAAGYDIKSYEQNKDGNFVEIHIEVKSAKVAGKYVEFFISENELNKFKNNENHRVYCLIKYGKNYKLHIVNKGDFFKNNYLIPMTYRVRIRVAE